MTDGEASSRERAHALHPACNIAGQAPIRKLLDVVDLAPRRSRLARLFGVSPLSSAGRDAYRAASGAFEVGTRLDGLGEQWHVLHSVPMGEGDDLGHLVIGPAGVFIVTTAVHAGEAVVASQRTLTVSGVRYPHIRTMESEMGRVERLLAAASGIRVEVMGILAVVEAKSVVVQEARKDVAVLASSGIDTWLRARPRAMTPLEIETIAMAADRASTWGAGTSRRDDPRHLGERFEAVRLEVAEAFMRQRLWSTGIAGAAVVVVVAYALLASALGLRS